MSAVRQRGFSAVEVVIALLVLAAIGVTGYLAFNRMQNANKEPSTSEQTANDDASSAPAIADTDDLDAAAKTLDKTDVDAADTDATELDSELNNF
jgi:prepilin-type N-terminal cleavage/methylation domain-containing protein